MPHPVGEHLRCDECGAEIVFVKACPCPETDPKSHEDICCNKQMRSLGVRPIEEGLTSGATPHAHGPIR